MTHVACRLTAKNRDQLRNSTLGNRVRATFAFFLLVSNYLVNFCPSQNAAYLDAEVAEERVLLHEGFLSVRTLRLEDVLLERRALLEQVTERRHRLQTAVLVRVLVLDLQQMGYASFSIVN